MVFCLILCLVLLRMIPYQLCCGNDAVNSASFLAAAVDRSCECSLDQNLYILHKPDSHLADEFETSNCS